MTGNIPTAEELLAIKETFDSEYPTVSVSDAIEAMIEFAKLHVEAQRRSIIENIILIENMRTNGEKVENVFNKDSDFYIDKESILNSYPLTNIK
jgi:hypothetical protein